MNEELEYVLETIRFKTSIYRDKKKRNLAFNDDDDYSNILNEYITNLQQENTRLKEELKYTIPMVEHNKIVSEKLKENARLKDKLNEINNLLNEPIFEYDNIPNGIEEEIEKLKNILKEN